MAKYVGVILATVFICILLGGVAAVLLSSKNIDFNGTIAGINVEVFSDAGLTQVCSSLNVGVIQPGTVNNQTVYIKNSGTIAETLTMTTSAWVPANAGTLLTLTWDRQNYVLGAGQSVKAILTLVVPANTGSLTTFGCSVTITGTG